jgi:hypothetical protein
MQTTMRQTRAWQQSGKCAATRTRCVQDVKAAAVAVAAAAAAMMVT